VADSDQSWWAQLDTSAKALISVIGVFTAAIAAWQVYENFVTDRSACTISGHVYDLQGRPLRDTSLGWAQNNPSVSHRIGDRPDFHKIAETGPDGFFTGSCKGAADKPDGSFELLYSPGFGGSGFPCGIKYSYQRFENQGEHSGVVINAPC
jgi:hypothetical protein